MIIFCGIILTISIFLFFITQEQKKKIVYWQKEYLFWKDKHALLQEEHNTSTTKHIADWNMLSQVIKEKRHCVYGKA